MLLRYDEDKFKTLVAKRKASGLFYEDEDFPGDDDECWFFMKCGEKVAQSDETAEKLKLSAKTEVDQDLRMALTDPDSGILRPGALPKISAGRQGSKELLDSMAKARPVSFPYQHLPTEPNYHKSSEANALHGPLYARPSIRFTLDLAGVSSKESAKA